MRKAISPGRWTAVSTQGKCTPTNQSAWYSASDQKTADPSSWNRFCSISLKGLQMLGWWIAFTFKIVLRFLSMHEPHFAFQEAHMGFSTHLPHCAGFITQLLVTVESPWTSNRHENIYFPDFIERVLRVLDKRETSAAKARARDARANRETGF